MSKKIKVKKKIQTKGKIENVVLNPICYYSTSMEYYHKKIMFKL